MLWNGVIKSVMLTYLKNFVVFFLGIKLIRNSSDDDGLQVDFGVYFLTILTGLPLVLFPVWSVIFLLCNKSNLKSEEFQQKYNSLYQNLKQNYDIHSPMVLLFPSIFALRRASYVMIAVFEFESIIFNIILLIIVSIIYFCFIASVRPFASPLLLKLESLNEFLLLTLCYHLLCFTDLTLISE